MPQRQWNASEQALIVAALERVLAAPSFTQAGRQSRLLRYVIEQTAAGHRERINQYSIAIDVFDRGAEFDPAVDSIVRVEFSRLRSKLREYYESRPDERVIFRLPKGRYSADVEIQPRTAADALTPDPRERPSIAVLPFASLDEEDGGEYFADGMTDDLITDLSRLAGLRVIARNSVFVYKDREVPVDVIGEELGIGHVLRGSVRRQGNRLRINAQLVHCRSGDLLWAERFDREAEDVFEVQDEVGRRIVKALSIALSADDRFRFAERGTRNLEAYDCVLRAAALGWSREGIEAAHALYEQAVSLDPEYALPRAKIGENRWYAWRSAWTDDACIDRALEAAEHALRLDGELAEAHSIVGFIQLWRGVFEQAELHGERAISLDAGNVRALERRVIALAYLGGFAEADAYLERAASLNPHEPYFYPRGVLAFMRGDMDGALDLLSRGAARFPSFLPTRQLLAAIHALRGEAEQARGHVDRIRRTSPRMTLERMTSPRWPAVNDPVSRLREGLAAAWAMHEAGVPERS